MTTRHVAQARPTRLKAVVDEMPVAVIPTHVRSLVRRITGATKRHCLRLTELGRLTEVDLASLKRERINAESPANYAAMVRRERSFHAVEQALSAAARHVQERGADLPDPDPETGSGVSSDGLLTLRASQLAEARA